MAPFSNFPYLKQAFTEGEAWKVEPERINELRSRGVISDSLADRIYRNGALGSHVEIIERNEGYKGFNQESVSKIIRKTNPGK